MLSGPRQVSFGIKTSQSGLSYREILRVWQEAEEIELFEHAWLWDHMVPIWDDPAGAALEAWTLLAALAVQTRRLRLGVIVTSNRFRPPALLAKMAATVDVVSGGRLVFGIGAGGSETSDLQLSAAVHREYDAYGIDVVSAAESLAALRETCVVAKRLWSEGAPFDFKGRCYELRGAICEPKPLQRPHPPFLIGAGGEQTALGVVAEHADIWSCPTRGNIDDFLRRNAALVAHCERIGRDPDEITRSVQVFVSAREASSSDQDAAADSMSAREFVFELIDAGVSHIVIAPRGPIPGARWVADEIVGPVLSEL